MNAPLIVSISLVFVGVVGIGLAIPFLSNRIPRNSAYGFRTKRTLSCDEIWYPANRFAAKWLIVWGIFNIAIGAISFWFQPLSPTMQLVLVLPPLSVVALCAYSVFWVGRTFKHIEPASTVDSER